MQIELKENESAIVFSGDGEVDLYFPDGENEEGRKSAIYASMVVNALHDENLSVAIYDAFEETINNNG